MNQCFLNELMAGVRHAQFVWHFGAHWLALPDDYRMGTASARQFARHTRAFMRMPSSSGQGALIWMLCAQADEAQRHDWKSGEVAKAAM